MCYRHDRDGTVTAAVLFLELTHHKFVHMFGVYVRYICSSHIVRAHVRYMYARMLMLYVVSCFHKSTHTNIQDTKHYRHGSLSDMILSLMELKRKLEECVRHSSCFVISNIGRKTKHV